MIREPLAVICAPMALRTLIELLAARTNPATPTPEVAISLPEITAFDTDVVGRLTSRVPVAADVNVTLTLTKTVLPICFWRPRVVNVPVVAEAVGV